MRFQVPQFTDVEDKIVGPFTLKQFIYIAGAIGICIVLYSFLPLFLAIMLMIPVAALGAALAFLKINNKPFINILESFFKYMIGNKLYIWKHSQKKVSKNKEERDESLIPRLSSSKLKELTWNLDIKDTASGPLEEKILDDNDKRLI